MPQFTPDIVTFKDLPGYGMWDDNHHREHLQFAQVLAAQAAPILIPVYDFMNFLTAADRRSIVESHQSIHEVLSGITGITAPDFSGYDLKDEASFYNFTQDHATVHAQIRQFLGIL